MQSTQHRRDGSMKNGCRGFALMHLQLLMGAVFLVAFFQVTAEAYAAKYCASASVDSVSQTLTLKREAGDSRCETRPNSPGAK